MDDSMLRIVLLLAYGPFVMMLLVFLIGLVMKWTGDSTFLDWLIQKTGPQQPVKK